MCPAIYRSLEHLLRYCAQPPFALERLSVIRGPDGRATRVRYVLPRHKAANWVGRGRGRKSTRPGANRVVELTPFEFLDRLADLVPPPRKYRHRYHGVFAPNHQLRKAVTALAIGNVSKQREATTGGDVNDGRATEGCCDANQKPRSHETSRIAWAKLMARVGEEFPLECPACGGDIRLIAFITDPGPIRKILTHLGEPLEPPPVSLARGPPTDWAELVQAHDDRTIFQVSPDELPVIKIHSLRAVPDARSHQTLRRPNSERLRVDGKKNATAGGKAACFGNAFLGPGRPSPQLTSRSSARKPLRTCHWPGYPSGMTRSLTIKLPDDSGQTLEELGRRQCRSAEDVAEDILERALAVARWRQNREQLQSRAEAAGFRSEDDILDAIS